MTPIDLTREKIYVSGHGGMVGAAICRALQRQGATNLLTATRQTLDLTDQRAVFAFFEQQRPQLQVICAALVGGIVANDTYPGDFIGQNLMIQTNLLEAARRFGCRKTVFMASGCIYPRITPQPISESQLLSGALEETNEWYAMAKLAGIKMGQAYRRQYGMEFIGILPSNLYGQGDDFDLESSHVIPGLLHRFHLAKEAGADDVTVWGSGRAMREFLHVDDLAEASALLLQKEHIAPGEELFNVGCGEDITIARLAALIAKTVGFGGKLVFDSARPDGTPRKLLDSSRMFALGWRPRISLQAGLADTYRWFAEHSDSLRKTRRNQWR